MPPPAADYAAHSLRGEELLISKPRITANDKVITMGITLSV